MQHKQDSHTWRLSSQIHSATAKLNSSTFQSLLQSLNELTDCQIRLTNWLYFRLLLRFFWSCDVHYQNDGSKHFDFFKSRRCRLLVFTITIGKIDTEYELFELFGKKCPQKIASHKPTNQTDNASLINTVFADVLFTFGQNAVHPRQL